MEELSITPKELKQLIDDSKMIGGGFFGTVFEYKDRLIKLDNVLYNLLQVNSAKFADQLYREHYGLHIKELNNPNHISMRNFANPKQIELLASKQEKIALTQMPKGIVRVGETVPGIIIPYHKDYQNISLLPQDDYLLLLKILRKLLLAVKELADNEIAHHDLVHTDRWGINRDYNVLYKDSTPQIIDIDGRLIACGDDFKDAQQMYNQLGDIILGYFKVNGLTTSLRPKMINDEKDAALLIDELEEQLKKMGK